MKNAYVNSDVHIQFLYKSRDDIGNTVYTINITRGNKTETKVISLRVLKQLIIEGYTIEGLTRKDWIVIKR